MPVHDITPRAEDGKHLRLAVAKLERRIDIGPRPFLIYAVGSSWTTYLGDGEALRQIIRQRFPNAPEVVYKKHVGSGSPYQYARGWVQTEVVAELPDLFITYTGGEPEDLRLMLRELRRHTTADIIVPSLHYFENETLDDQTVNPEVWDQVREICREYKAEFVDNRRELAAWLKANDRSHKDLLMDAVHQSELGALLINENIGRHLTPHPSPACEPEKMERRITLAEAVREKQPEVTVSLGWDVCDGQLVSSKKDASIKIAFSGTRVDLRGKRLEQGGGFRVLVDGKPADQTRAFFVSFVRPSILNIGHMGEYPRSSGGNWDTGPHGVSLGENIVPQTWTIRMLNDQGDYELSGSVTREDGRGNNKSMFKGKSGQIIIDPAVWRHPQANRPGDQWTFNVYQTGQATVSCRLDSPTSSALAESLIQNLPNGPHTLEIRADGVGAVAVEAFQVFEPMLK
jgi:hypothetical protein